MNKSTNGTKAPKKTTYPYRGRRWAITIHGHEQQDFDKLVKFFNTDEVECACIAKEWGKYRIHPHWQIYLEFFERVNNIKTKLSAILGHDNSHIEAAKGTKQANIKYLHATEKHYEMGMIEYAKNIGEVPKNYRAKTVEFWRSFKPRPFQQSIIDIAKGEPDKRYIYWIYETIGNTGKSILIEYLCIFHGAIATGGRAADMKYAVARYQELTHHDPVVICLNLARSASFTKATTLSVEELKDGVFFSGKYESTNYLAFNKPHIFIFANKKPDKRLFSSDRWRVFTINSQYELKPA